MGKLRLRDLPKISQLVSGRVQTLDLLTYSSFALPTHHIAVLIYLHECMTVAKVH